MVIHNKKTMLLMLPPKVPMSDEPTTAEDKDEDAVARDGPAAAGLVEERELKTRCASGVTRRNIGEVVEAR